jgi:FkbM family methyltransferase
MNLSRCRKVVDKFAPSLGRLYRSLRDAKMLRESAQMTKYGFSLSGDANILDDDWERDEKDSFLEILNTYDTFIDIGANVGFYTCLAASRGKHTIAFEPSPRNLSFLYKNLWENKFTSVEVFPLGLAGQCGLGRIYGFGLTSSFISGWNQARGTHFDLVPINTLDAFAAYRFKNRKLLIKMDVEGFELDVLAGAALTLDLNPKPAWLVEILLCNHCIPGGISRHFSEVFEIFWKHGYQCRMPDSANTPVVQADVNRWISNGFVDSGMRDFIFSG